MSTVTVRSESGDTKLVYEPGVTLLDVLSAESFGIAAPCGGQAGDLPPFPLGWKGAAGPRRKKQKEECSHGKIL